MLQQNLVNICNLPVGKNDPVHRLVVVLQNNELMSKHSFSIEHATPADFLGTQVLFGLQ